MQQNELTKAIAAPNLQLSEILLQLKRAGEDREIEKRDVRPVLADQRAIQKFRIASLNIFTYSSRLYHLGGGGPTAGPQLPS